MTAPLRKGISLTLPERRRREDNIETYEKQSTIYRWEDSPAGAMTLDLQSTEKISFWYGSRRSVCCYMAGRAEQDSTFIFEINNEN